MLNKIKLIVGLGNPGQQYEATRHNVGAWFVELLADNYATSLQFENKFHGKVGRVQRNDSDFWLLIPSTFMNNSGLAVKMLTHFYKIPPDEC